MFSHGRRLFDIFVIGHPRQRGSKRHIGGGRLMDEAKGSKEWMRYIQYAVRQAYGGQPVTGPVTLCIEFHMPRPKCHFDKTGMLKRGFDAAAYLTSPDTDKLCRTVLDALSNVVYVDDKQVVMIQASKMYARGQPGVFVKAFC